MCVSESVRSSLSLSVDVAARKGVVEVVIVVMDIVVIIITVGDNEALLPKIKIYIYEY